MAWKTPVATATPNLRSASHNSSYSFLACSGRRRSNKARPALTARVAIKRELRDNQRAALHIKQGAVHFSLIVLKNPQVCDLRSHTGSDSGRIVATDAKQNHQARRDFSRDMTLHDYARSAHTLDNGSHCGLRKPTAVVRTPSVCAATPVIPPSRSSYYAQHRRYRIVSSKSARRHPALCSSSRTIFVAHTR